MARIRPQRAGLPGRDDTRFNVEALKPDVLSYMAMVPPLRVMGPEPSAPLLASSLAKVTVAPLPMVVLTGELVPVVRAPAPDFVSVPPVMAAVTWSGPLSVMLRVLL